MTALLVATNGGHLAQLVELAPRLDGIEADRLWITFDSPQSRSLLADPPVLVLDEPTAHLDGPTARAIADEMLDSAARVGRSILWITHGTVGLDAMDRVVHLEAGTDPSVSRPALAASAAGA